MSTLKKTLLTLSAAAAVTGMIAATPVMAMKHAKNPCAAKVNPCGAKNPCAAKANPCGAKNPCAAKKKM